MSQLKQRQHHWHGGRTLPRFNEIFPFSTLDAIGARCSLTVCQMYFIHRINGMWCDGVRKLLVIVEPGTSTLHLHGVHGRNDIFDHSI